MQKRFLLNNEKTNKESQISLSLKVSIYIFAFVIYTIINGLISYFFHFSFGWLITAAAVVFIPRMIIMSLEEKKQRIEDLKKAELKKQFDDLPMRMDMGSKAYSNQYSNSISVALFCRKCGKRLVKGATACNYCGCEVVHVDKSEEKTTCIDWAAIKQKNDYYQKKYANTTMELLGRMDYIIRKNENNFARVDNIHILTIFFSEMDIFIRFVFFKVLRNNGYIDLSDLIYFEEITQNKELTELHENEPQNADILNRFTMYEMFDMGTQSPTNFNNIIILCSLLLFEESKIGEFIPIQKDLLQKADEYPEEISEIQEVLRMICQDIKNDKGLSN